MRVVVAVTNEESINVIDELAAELPDARLASLRVDPFDREAVLKAAVEAEDRFGPVQVVCNCVRTGSGVRLAGSPLVEAQRAARANLVAAVNTFTAFIPTMVSHGRGGRLMNLASDSSFLATAESCAYVGSMFALRAMVETIRQTSAVWKISASLLYVADGEWKEPARFASDFLAGLEQASPYICVPDSILEPLREVHERIASALPTEPADPRRAALERRRYSAVKRADLAIPAL
jgi:NAD(P)-dependent dehydrogenase (short-subunit alcohol dehydrogenase family)